MVRRKHLASSGILLQAIIAGVGWHHAGLENGDRELVEGLFLAQDLAVRRGGEAVEEGGCHLTSQHPRELVCSLWDV